MRAAHLGNSACSPLLAPIVAAVSVNAILIFRDQTLAGELQATSLKRALGPSLSWFDEHIRYERLFMASPDGSVARRFALLVLLVALGGVGGDDVAQGPNSGHGGRTQPPHHRHHGDLVHRDDVHPTKWTHHFGVFAGLAGSLGGVGRRRRHRAAMRSRRNRTLFAVVVMFIVALSFASVNGWWYVSNFGVPWSNAFPQWHFGFTTGFLGLTLLVALVAAWFHFVKAVATPIRRATTRAVRSNHSVPVGDCRVGAGLLPSAVADARDDRPIPGVVRGALQPAGADR